MPVDVVDYCFAFDACHLSVTASARRTEAEGEVWAIFDVLCFGPPQFLGGANGWRGGTLPMATTINPIYTGGTDFLRRPGDKPVDLPGRRYQLMSSPVWLRIYELSYFTNMIHAHRHHSNR
jgi:hypothetical protein